MSDEAAINCAFCSGIISDVDDQRTMPDGDIVCADCTLYCESCNTLMANDDALHNDDSIYCSECAMSCENCSTVTHNDDTHSRS